MTADRSLVQPGFLTSLPFALRLDAVVTGANGLAYLAVAGPLESLLGMDAAFGRVFGAALLMYAAVVWGVSMRPGRVATTAVIEANLMYAVLSVVTVIAGWLSLSAVGNVWAVLQGLVVAGFGALQYLALRRV